MNRVREHDHNKLEEAVEGIAKEFRKISEKAAKQEEALEKIAHDLHRLTDYFTRPVKLIITQLGDSTMTQGTLKGIAPGGTGQFGITPIDSTGNPSQLPAGVVPAWTSSDPTNAPVTASADGLTATVVTTTSYTGCTLSVTAALPDGTLPAGTAPVPVLTLEVASFIINQTA